MNIDEARKRATLNIEEAGKLLGLGRASAYAAAQRGEIPTRRFGRRVLVPVPALLALLGESAPHEA
jgi:excisionase family DNA binding protein